MVKSKEPRTYLQVKVFEAKNLKLSCSPKTSTPPAVFAIIKQGTSQFKTAPVIPIWKNDSSGWCASWNEEGDFAKAHINKPLKVIISEKNDGSHSPKIGKFDLQLDSASLKAYATPSLTTYLPGQWYGLESITDSESRSSLSSFSSSTSLSSRRGEILLQVHWIGQQPPLIQANLSRAPSVASNQMSIGTTRGSTSSLKSDNDARSSKSAHSEDKGRGSILGIFSHRSSKPEKGESSNLISHSRDSNSSLLANERKMDENPEKLDSDAKITAVVNLQPEHLVEKNETLRIAASENHPTTQLDNTSDEFLPWRQPPSFPIEIAAEKQDAQLSKESELPVIVANERSANQTVLLNSTTVAVASTVSPDISTSRNDSLSNLRRHSFAGEKGHSVDNAHLARATSETALQSTMSDRTLNNDHDGVVNKGKGRFSMVASVLTAQAIKKRLKRHNKEHLPKEQISNGTKNDKSQSSVKSDTPSEYAILNTTSSTRDQAPISKTTTTTTSPLPFQKEIAAVPIQVTAPVPLSNHSNGITRGNTTGLSSATMPLDKKTPRGKQRNRQDGEKEKTPENGTDAAAIIVPRITEKSFKGALIQDILPSYAFIQATTAISLMGRKMGCSRNDVKSVNVAGIECIDRLIEWSFTRIVIVVGPLEGAYEGVGDVSIVTESCGVLSAPSKFTWLRDPWPDSELARTWTRLTDIEKKEHMHRLTQETRSLRGEIKKLYRQLEDAVEDKRDTHRYIEKLLYKIMNTTPHILEQDSDEE